MHIEFDNRQHGYSKLLIVLAGYKEALWDTVFGRLIKYIDKDIDVCIVTSGLLSEPLRDICEKNNWSYMSTSINNLCLAQNECINAFPSAKYIFKMDEDMFVTKGIFAKLYNDYAKCKQTMLMEPSAIVPLINVNCITYQFLLKWSGLLKTFEEKVGFKPYMTNGLHHHKEVLESPDMAKFMWSHFNIDEVSIPQVGLIPSPGRFSIGLVMFERSTWLEFEKFPVDLTNELEYKRVGLGEDEKHLCRYAMSTCKPIMIDFNVCAGHLGYGPQTKEMMSFFKEHPEYFK